MRKLLWISNVLFVLFFLSTLSVIPSAAQQPDNIRFTFEGCRNDGSIVLPIGGVFVCPDKLPGNPNQDSYTGGELGKGWNELDLVPYRLTTHSGAQSSTPNYGVTVAAGYITAKTFPGYDVLSFPVVNTAKSDSSCSISAGPQSFQGDAGNPFSKDVITAIYRDVHIHQDPGTTCVFDWYQRLAVGSSQNPGASLHSYLFDQPGFQGHDSDIPIMLGAAQGVSKTMSAVQNTDHTWTIAVDPTQATVNFPNTCDPTQPNKKQIPVSISWTKLAADPFNITITTTIQATNPAARALTLNLTDIIYAGSGQSNPLGSASTPAGGVIIPANTANFTVLTHTITVPNGQTLFNDVATGTFVDTVTGVPVPGPVTATASSPVQQGGIDYDNSASIKSIETIFGDNLTFSVDSFLNASGSFANSYVPGTQTPGPVEWDSVSQSTSGSVTFNKTIYSGGPSQGSGSLNESATLTGSDFAVTGFTVNAIGGASVSTDARVTLTINKTVDIPLTTGSATFTFHVKDASDTEVVNPAPTVTISAGQSSNSVQVLNLAPGNYTISEDAVVGWTADSNKSASIALPACSGAVTFNNLRHALDLVVTKTASASFDRKYEWSIAKNVDKTSISTNSGGDATFNYTVDAKQTGTTDSGWVVNGTITVTNPNDWEDFTSVNVTDVLDNNGTCTVTGGSNATVPANGSITLPYSCTFASAPNLNSGSNTATATWDASATRSDNSSSTGSAEYAFGDPAHTTNKTITVTDTFDGATTTLGSATAVDAAPFTTQSFTYAHTVQAPSGDCATHDNTATITETQQSDNKSVKVCGASDLIVSKTATTAFKRTYNWNISKGVDRGLISTYSGGDATFNYSVIASETGFTDSDWTMSGIITVTNPNAWEAFSGVNITDGVDNNGVCVVTAGTGVTVPANGSVNVNYTCTYAAAPAPAAGTNTATATWDAAAQFTQHGSASGTAPYLFDQPTSRVNQTITVTDTFNGVTTTLGTVTATDVAPFASSTFTYSHTVQAPSGTCATYDNKATITETNQSDSKTVKVCGASDLAVSKTAVTSFNRKYDWTTSKSVDHESISGPSGSEVVINYGVHVDQTGFTDSGWQVNGTITVNNPNDWEAFTGVDITDLVDNNGTCVVTGGTGVSIPANGTVTLNYTCTYAAAPAPASGINTATASWSAALQFTQHGSSAGTAGYAFGSPTSLTDQTITITDTFNGTPQTLGTLTATDVAPFASATFNYAQKVQAPIATCGTFTNRVSLGESLPFAIRNVKVCGGSALTVSKTAVTSYNRDYNWTIAKDVDKTLITTVSGGNATFNYTVNASQTGITDKDWVVTGTITVNNPNDWEDFTGVNVSDLVDNNGTCVVSGGTGITVPAHGSATVNYTCTYASTPTPGSGTNTATATWNAGGLFTDGSAAQGTAAYAFGEPAHLTHQTITVTDIFNGGSTTLGTLTATNTAPFASGNYNYAHTVQAPAATCATFNNTAAITETGQSAGKSVKACGASDLTVSKTAGTAFARNFNWNIQKSVDKTQVDQVGGSTVFKYSIAVNETGFNDSGWVVSGSITVSNPNDWEDFTGVNVSDLVDNNGTCVVTGGSGATVPAHGSITLPYTCSYASAPAPGSGTNTASATWNAAALSTPTGGAQGTAGYVFGNPTTVTNQTITVTDTFNGGAPVVLGTVTATTTAPLTSKTFTESRTINIPQTGCVSYPNLARISETGQNSGVTVKVCGPVASGALTIGFWQNKNGQGIITGSGPAIGTCKLTTWLRQFAPYQDLSSTATCTQAAAYIYNIIKNASSAGASMNAMLKAQMLATALDVYFSDPALGGNKIGAPSGPIGSLTIDLTHIWGNQNSSGGFGGATSMTVMQMLAFASSQSNAAGSLWYGNVKTTQEKAKNAFDSINNQTAFSF